MLQAGLCAPGAIRYSGAAGAERLPADKDEFMAATPTRRGAAFAAAVLFAPFALGGCELGLHEVEQATTDGCEAWQARCPAVVDFAGPGPTNPARIDIARTRIVASAENAPYRPCDGIALACQARVSGDVLWDRYILVLAGGGDNSAGSGAAAPPPAPPTATGVEPAGAAAPGDSGRIVRTEGARRGDGFPALRNAPSR